MTHIPARMLTCLVFLSALGALTIAKNAVAADKIAERVVNIAGMQRMLTQQMSKELLLVALDVDKDLNLKRVQSTRELFNRTLTGLRDGDVALGLPGTTNSEALLRLSNVENVWGQFDRAIAKSLTNRGITARQMDAIAGLNLSLLKATHEAAQAYEHEANINSILFSVLGLAIDYSARQRMLIEKMAKEYLLIAYGHEVDINKRNLAKSIILFERTLHALISGDSELRLMSAPTREIKAQLRKIQRIWDELLPLVQDAADKGKTNKEAVVQVARFNGPLRKAMNTAVFMYESL